MNQTGTSPLNQPATIPVVRQIFTDGIITKAQLNEMEKVVCKNLPWHLWLDRGLLTLSVSLIISGIIYFFAHNWNELTSNEKLLLAGGAVLLSLVGATRAGLDHFLGKLLLLTSSVLVGVYIAVFGQIYQTGADTYEWFTAWAFLIFPWVALGRFMPLWIFWLILLNQIVAFYWQANFNVINYDYQPLFQWETSSLIVLNFFALVIREIVERFSCPWQDSGWCPLFLLLVVTGLATVRVQNDILRTYEFASSRTHFGIDLAIYTVFIILTGFYYLKIRRLFPALAILTLGLCLTLMGCIGRLLFSNQQTHDPIAECFLMGLAILAIFGGGVFLLKKIKIHFFQ